MNRIFILIAAFVAAIVFVFSEPGKPGNFFNAFLFFCICLSIVVSDIENMSVPNEMILSGISLRCIEIKYLSESIISALLFTALLSLIMIIAKRVLNTAALGAGDIKLFFMLSIYRSFSGNLYALFFACFIGLLLFLILHKNIKAKIPFAPAIVLGWFCSFFVVQ